MDRRLNDDELDELLGAYALDALDDDERDAVERYLVRSPRAREEVAQHREIASLLSFGGADAPAGMWDRIAASLDTPAAAKPPRVTPPPVLHELRARRVTRPAGNGRSGIVQMGLAALAAAAVVLVAVLVVRDGDGGTPARTDLVALFEDARSDPAAQVATLVSDVSDVAVEAALLPSGDGYLDARSLAAVRADRTYQLWGVIDDEVVSLGVLGARPRVVSFHADGPVTALVITEETAGGVAVSDQPALLAGALA